MGEGGLPFRPEPDERTLWSEAEKEATALAAAGLLVEDPALLEYVGGVAAKLAAPIAGAPLARVSVFRDPGLGAFSLPDGRVYVHTGLLAQMESEAELAGILAHELSHVIHRHALVAARRAHGSRPGTTAHPLARPSQGHHGSARTLADASETLLNRGLRLAHRADVEGLGADLERHADEEGLARMQAAGYDPRGFLRLLERLERLAIVTDARSAWNPFGNRSALHERVETVRRLVGDGAGAAGPHGDPEFMRRVLPAVRENALLLLRSGRFTAAEGLLERVLAATPGDAVAHLYVGDLHRLRAQQVDGEAARAALLERARRAYDRAALLDPAFADPWRQLGLLHYQAREPAEASQAFARYLALRPAAPDARRIREFIAELAR
jgi:predicted Zn-dependent protease